MPRAAVLVLLACALLLRLPSGWMPVADASGLHVTLCTGMAPVAAPSAMPMAMAHGPAAMAMAHDHRHLPSGQDHPGHDHPGGDRSCPFAGAAMAFAPPSFRVPRLPPLPAAAVPAMAGRTVTVARGLAGPPPPATGPPLLA